MYRTSVSLVSSVYARFVWKYKFYELISSIILFCVYPSTPFKNQHKKLPQQSNFCTQLVGMAALNDRQLIGRLCGLRRLRAVVWGKLFPPFPYLPISVTSLCWFIFWCLCDACMSGQYFQLSQRHEDRSLLKYCTLQNISGVVPLDAVVWPEGQVL